MIGGEMITKRAVEISQTYSPRGHGRKITVDSIPATEITVGDDCDVVLDLTVSERIQTLVQEALRSNDSVEQHIAYRAVDQNSPTDQGRGYVAS
jgi:hypothetical protein